MKTCSSRLVVCVMAAVLGAAESAAAQTFESRYTPTDEGGCEVHENGDALGQDWVLQRCPGPDGLTAWMLYQDSVRLQVAFGPEDFTAYRPWSNERQLTWPIEWRGRRGQPPHAAIIRLTPLTDGPPAQSVLAVFRIWPDRPHCYLGEASSNRAARRLADRAASLDACAAAD